MPRKTKADRRKLAADLLRQLRRMYPDAACTLDHAGPLQLLVATILSAQCTDERVNQVTPGLFAKYGSAAAFADADAEELMDDIRSTGFYRNKARSIQAACRDIVEKHGRRVPETLEELTGLAGVGRKTANVVLGSAFGRAVGVAVDTHVGRLARRLGLTRHDGAEKIERDLMELVPQADWIFLAHALILHGRGICAARKPACGACKLSNLCPSAFAFPHNKSPTRQSRYGDGARQ